jgi:uncharacterized protein (DUF3820 family)
METKTPSRNPLVSLLGDMTNPPLDGNNPHFHSKFATLAGIITHIRPVLQKHCAAISQNVEAKDDTVGVNTQIIFPEHTFLFGPISMKHGGDAQKLGSVVTYLRRYGLLAALGIVGDDDDDGNGASQAPAQKAPQQRPVAPPPAPARQQAPTPQPKPQPRQEAPAQRPTPPPSNDAGGPDTRGPWADVTMHFGKHKGKRLGDLENKTLHWFRTDWAVKKRGDTQFPPKQIDLDLMEALDEWHHELEATRDVEQPKQHPLPPEVADSDIPF